MLCAAPSTRLLSYRNRLRRYKVAEASRLITYTSRPRYTRGSTQQLQLTGDSNNKMKLLILLRRTAVVGIFVRGSTLFERFQRRSMFLVFCGWSIFGHASSWSEWCFNCSCGPSLCWCIGCCARYFVFGLFLLGGYSYVRRCWLPIYFAKDNFFQF
ncbi:hypothetical protein VPH35_019175 [Triticum aestivum]